MSDRIITPEGQLSYPHLFEPRAAVEGATAKYSTTMVFPAGTDLTALKKAAVTALQEKFGDRLKGAKLQQLNTQYGYAPFLCGPNGFNVRLPWRDHPEAVATKGYPEGSTFISMSNTRPVAVVTVYPDANGKPAALEDRSKVYAGVFARALTHCYTYDQKGNRGASFGLDGIQITRDGDRMDGGINVADMFEADPNAVADLSDLEDEGSATAAVEGDDLADLIG